MAPNSGRVCKSSRGRHAGACLLKWGGRSGDERTTQLGPCSIKRRARARIFVRAGGGGRTQLGPYHGGRHAGACTLKWGGRSGGIVSVSSAGGAEASPPVPRPAAMSGRWRGRGRIVYRSGDGRGAWAVTATPTARTTKPRALRTSLTGE